MNDEDELTLPQSHCVASTISSELNSIRISGPMSASAYVPFTGQPVEPLKTVEYEAGMWFFATVDIVLNHPELLKDRIFKNALLEDAVLHARSLCTVRERE